MSAVTVYSRPGCQMCRLTVLHLERLGIPHTTVPLTGEIIAELADPTMTQAPIVTTPDGQKWSGYRPDRIESLAQKEVAAGA